MNQINKIIRSCFCFVGVSVFLLSSMQLPGEEVQTKDIMQKFDKHYGQVEVGGRYAGIEFHKSWPTPSRISFYYPVANSVEFSNDYWKRYESMPFDIKLKIGGKEVQLGREPYDYQYVPYAVDFTRSFDDYRVSFDYEFCDNMPVAVMTLNIKDTSKERAWKDTLEYSLEIALKTSIHTCHTYALLDKANVSYTNDGTVCVTDFGKYKEAGNAALFIANAGLKPVSTGTIEGKDVQNPVTIFNYKKELSPGRQMKIVWLIGMCKSSETDQMVAKALKEWKDGVKASEKRVLDFVNIDNFKVDDPVLMETNEWSKAEIASLSHYIDGDFISMPCPAEYNFFFTHDLLVTGLGVVLFDPAFVKHGYEFLLKYYDKDDNILEHAYYWKDDKYVTEYVSPSHWNNLWFIISVGSYLKHTNDIETVKKLFPIMTVSMDNILDSVEKDGLVHALYPDWWDAGKVNGARAYVTILTYRALQEYVYTAITTGQDNDNLLEYLDKAQKMKQALADKLWDSNKKYLMNQLTGDKMDEHYYIGSLLAPAYGALDKEKSTELLNTADKILKDEKLGIRVAMPMDFDKQEDVYKFVNHEEGMPGYYFNGAIWPQGNIWYAVSLIANGQVNKAEEIIKKYITIDGIKNSPNGIPSFYETRITAQNTEYGQIDKPTFLWQGGWYIYILYQLAGMRECPWNIYFVPVVPENLTNAAYKLTLFGSLCNVGNKGKGNFFKEIEVDGKVSNSAVITAPAKNIVLVRGIPEKPYLSEASCIVKNVQYNDGKLIIESLGIKGENASFTIVSPLELDSVSTDGNKLDNGSVTSEKVANINIYNADIKFDSPKNTTVITFKN